jgi:hypothetical protein
LSLNFKFRSRIVAAFHEGNRHLAHASGVEAPAGERSREEPGGASLVEPGVIHFVQDRDGEGHGRPVAQEGAFPSALSRALPAVSSVVGLRGGLGVLDTRSEKADQGLPDGLARFVDVVHGQLALVELPVLELSPDGVRDHVLDALGGGFGQRFDGCFDRVGEHHYAGLFGVWQPARVTKSDSRTDEGSRAFSTALR